MRALVSSSTSEEHIELREVAAPDPAPNEALVDVRAVSLNRGEMHRLASAEDGARFGWDLAGVVARSAQNGQGPAAGTRVVGFVMNTAWAEQAAVPLNRLTALPDDVSFEQAATLPVAGLTALRILRAGGLLLGKRVLVTGASGGVGRFAVQLAHLSGAQVTAVVGNDQRAQGLRDLGANEVITDLQSVEQPFHLILESVGGPSLATAMRSVVPGGVIVTFGNSSQSDTTVSIATFYPRSGARIQAFSLLAPTEPQNFGEDLAELLALISSGQLRAEIGYQGSWREASSALQALRARRVQGKAILRID